jgi:hypothetical protein
LPEHFGNCAAFVGINSLTSRATLAIGETSRLDAIQRRVRMYKAVTRGIEVTAEPFYLEDQSEPEDNRYVWGYRITIANNSSQTAMAILKKYRAQALSANSRRLIPATLINTLQAAP